MTDTEYKKELMGDASMAAQDCKEKADGIMHDFKKGDDTSAISAIASLEARVMRLRTIANSIQKAGAQ